MKSCFEKVLPIFDFLANTTLNKLMVLRNLFEEVDENCKYMNKSLNKNITRSFYAHLDHYQKILTEEAENAIEIKEEWSEKDINHQNDILEREFREQRALTRQNLVAQFKTDLFIIQVESSKGDGRGKRKRRQRNSEKTGENSSIRKPQKKSRRSNGLRRNEKGNKISRTERKEKRWARKRKMDDVEKINESDDKDGGEEGENREESKAETEVQSGAEKAVPVVKSSQDKGRRAMQEMMLQQTSQSEVEKDGSEEKQKATLVAESAEQKDIEAPGIDEELEQEKIEVEAPKKERKGKKVRAKKGRSGSRARRNRNKAVR